MHLIAFLVHAVHLSTRDANSAPGRSVVGLVNAQKNLVYDGVERDDERAHARPSFKALPLVFLLGRTKKTFSSVMLTRLRPWDGWKEDLR